MKMRAVANVVGSCFYAELRTHQGIGSADGRVAFDHWVGLCTTDTGNVRDMTKVFDDLQRLGREAFASDWAFLVECVETTSIAEMYAMLHEAYGQRVDEGLAARAAADSQKGN